MTRPVHRRVLSLAAASFAAASAIALLSCGQPPQDGQTPAVPPAKQDDAQGKTPPPLPAPGTADSLIGLVTAPTDSLPRFETKGIDYETLGIAVYRADGDWYLSGLKAGGREWISARNTVKFFPIAELVMNRLNYLTPSWDGRIREASDPASASREVAVKKESGEAPAKVLEVSGSGSALALKVEVYERSPCETTGPPKVVATGWVSAWAKDGQPNAWFYSRGC